jgi:hypothetical protein
MAIDSVLMFLTAVALPVWLVVEEVVHRERRRPAEAAHTVAVPPAVAAPGAA